MQDSVLNSDTSILGTNTKSPNIWNISVTLSVLNLPTSIEFNFNIPENICDISCTFEVSKVLIISKLVKLWQYWNIPFILVTWGVLNLSVLNFKSTRFLHPANIECILVTRDVSKLSKLREVN